MQADHLFKVPFGGDEGGEDSGEGCDIDVLDEMWTFEPPQKG